MKIRIERLEIDVPGFMEALGDIVLGDAQAERQADLAADRDRAQHIWNYAQTALKLLGEYLKVRDDRPAGTDDAPLMTPAPVSPSSEESTPASEL